MLNLSSQKQRKFKTQLFVSNWWFFSSKALLNKKSSRSRRFCSKQLRSQQKQKKENRWKRNWRKKNKDKYRSFRIINNYYTHCYCKKYSSNFISSSSITSFENLLNLFAVAFTFYYQAIFIKIIIIFELNSLRISSFIEFSKMITLIFFSIAMSLTV